MSDSRATRQARANWGQLLLTLIIGGVPTAICFILGWWWWGTLLLLLTLFAACFSFSLDVYPIAFTVFAIFALAWLSGAWLDVLLHRGGESAWWRDALPILGGTAIGVALPALFWFVVFVVSTQWVLGLPQSLNTGWWPAFAFVAARAFGLARPYVLVENGEMKTLRGKGSLDPSIEPELLARFGGPCPLVVGEGNVVVLERGGQLSRILGMGTHTLRHGEWFKEPVETKGIHDLRGGGGPAMEVKDVRTKDGVPLEIKIGGGCKLELKSDTDKRPASRYAGAESSSPVIAPNSHYPVYEETIRKAVYQTGKGGWQTAFPGGAVGPLRNVVARYTFDQIFPSPGPEDERATHQRVVAQMQKEIMEEIGQKPAANGIVAGGISIQEIKPPEEMRQAMLERWAAPLKTAVRMQEARDVRDVLIVQSEGRAKSFEQVEQARRDASKDWAPIIDDLWKVLPKTGNDLVALEFVRMVRDLVSRIGKDESVDRRRLDTLQRIMEEEERLVAANLPSTHIYPLSTEPSDKDAE